MKVEISGNIIEQCNCDVMVFLDTSKYLDSSDNPILRITPPNWTQYVNIPYNMNGITVIEPSHIKHTSFPSGIYHIEQSVCPNEETKIAHCYLNICCDVERIKELACDLLEDDDKLTELLEVKWHLEMAQDLLRDDSCDKQKVVDYYNTAIKKLDKLEKEGCNGC